MSTPESDAAQEKILVEKGLTAPRITKSDIDALIDGATFQFWQVPRTTTTVCCMILENGFTFLGKSACVDPANFNAEVGCDFAKRNVLEKARSNLWELEGYALNKRR